MPITASKCLIIARIKTEIKEKCPNVSATFIEVEPTGQYAYKLGLDNITEKEYNF
ncbi:MAG: hypothetical protein K9M56_00525 [Victivallales bacterium]|nr:hypothetical protein [Victivallales bacterium]